MSELIPVTHRQIGGETVLSSDARDLHAYLNPGTDFNIWIARRIDEYGFEEGKDFQSFLGESTGGRPPKEYIVSLGMAKELAMVERTPKGKDARQYYIECERRLLDGESKSLTRHGQEASQGGLTEFRKAKALDLATRTAERIVAQFPGLSEQSRQTVFAKVINPVAGIEILALPRVEQKHLSAGEVGKKLGISSTMVGRIANQHGLKTDDYGLFVLDKSRHSTKQVESFVYNDAGVKAIETHLPISPPRLQQKQKPVTKSADVTAGEIQRGLL